MRASAEIQTDLDAARSALTTAMTAQEYSINTGQGSQTVKRASLSELRKLINSLEIELANAQSDEGGTPGVTAGEFERYP